MKQQFSEKLVLFVLVLCFVQETNAQVTIGSGQQPTKTALLDLKNKQNSTSGGVDSNRGLGLPRVELQDYKSIQMGATNDPELVGLEGESSGLLVYNVNPNFDRCKLTSIPTGLHVWNGKEWIGVGTEEHSAPIPPALKDPLYAPNAYLIEDAVAGSEFSYPIAKAYRVWEHFGSADGGNRWVLSGDELIGKLSASIVWESHVGTVENLRVDGNGRNAEIKFTYDNLPSNTVVALHIGPNGNSTDPIRWSWHIWKTGAIETIEFNGLTWMDRNLGATIASTVGNDDIYTYGLHYQWGRKDPFPYIYRVPVTTAFSALANDGNSPTRQNTLAYSISNPYTFLTVEVEDDPDDWIHDWYSPAKLEWDARWETKKVQNTECSDIVYKIPSITNPCPAGWHVPVGSDNHNKSPWDGLELIEPSEYETDKGWNWADAGFYNSAGSRYSIQGVLQGLNHGSYWSASPGGTYAKMLSFSDVWVDTWENGYRAEGFNVRCVE